MKTQPTLFCPLEEKHRYYTVQDVITAECTLEPMKCPHCGSTQEVTFYQYMKSAYCAECGNWSN